MRILITLLALTVVVVGALIVREAVSVTGQYLVQTAVDEVRQPAPCQCELPCKCCSGCRGQR